MNALQFSRRSVTTVYTYENLHHTLSLLLGSRIIQGHTSKQWTINNMSKCLHRRKCNAIYYKIYFFLIKFFSKVEIWTFNVDPPYPRIWWLWQTSEAAFTQVSASLTNCFLRGKFLKIFLNISLCKIQTPIVAPPYTYRS